MSEFDKPVQIGSGIFSNQSCNYDHPFPAIAEFVDNVHDLVGKKSKCKTNQMDIYIDNIPNNKFYKFIWNFKNNGNGISRNHMEEHVFSAGNSDKTTASLIGRYGVGMKAGALYLGDYLLMFSYDIIKKQKVIGFFSENYAKQRKAAVYLCEDVPSVKDLESTNPVIKSNVERYKGLVDILCKFSHIKSSEEIDALFNLIDPILGGSLVQIGISHDKYNLTYGSDNNQFRITKDDIIMECPYKGEHFKDTSLPSFCKSLRNYLSLLYLYNDKNKWFINFMDIKIEFLRIQNMNDQMIEVAQLMGLTDEKAPGEKYYCKFKSPSTFYDTCAQTETLHHKYHAKSLSDNRLRQYFISNRRDSPSASITLFKRKANYKGPFEQCDTTLFFNNDRFIDLVPIGIQKQTGNQLRKNNTVIVNSNCLIMDQTKQHITQNNSVFRAIYVKVKDLLYYNFNPSGYSKIHTQYNFDSHRNVIVQSPVEEDVIDEIDDDDNEIDDNDNEVEDNDNEVEDQIEETKPASSQKRNNTTNTTNNKYNVIQWNDLAPDTTLKKKSEEENDDEIFSAEMEFSDDEMKISHKNMTKRTRDELDVDAYEQKTQNPQKTQKKKPIYESSTTQHIEDVVDVVDVEQSHSVDIHSRITQLSTMKHKIASDLEYISKHTDYNTNVKILEKTFLLYQNIQALINAQL
jgi:hypothetical protein